MKLRDFLIEEPDRVWITGQPNYRQSNAIPFGYVDNKMVIGNFGTEHGSYTFGNIRSAVKSDGRLWVGDNIISFYGVDRKLSTIIKDLNTAIKAKEHTFTITPTWSIDTISFTGLKATGLKAGSTILRPLSIVLKEAPNGECDTYSLKWDKINDYANIYFRKLNS